MRTTLTIDDDVLAAAKHIAERERKSIGEVISALARQGKGPPEALAIRAKFAMVCSVCQRERAARG